MLRFMHNKRMTIVMVYIGSHTVVAD